MTQAVTTTLSTSHVVMEAGQERESEILVRNQGDEMDQFTVQVLGPAAAWTTVVPSVVTVPAGEEEWVRVVYAPPRSAEARQGKSHVAFRVTSYNDPSTSTLEEAVVEVAAFAELEVRLDPPQRTTTRRGRFVLTAINRGNSPVRCQAGAYRLDEGEGLDILIAGPEFVSEPGSTTQLPVRVQAKRRFMRGQDLSLPFAVEVNGDILERPAMVEGVLNQAPVLSAARTKLLLAAILLLALILGGWGVWYSLASNEEPSGGTSNGQLTEAPGAGGQQAPVLGEAGVAGTSGSAGLPGLPGAAGNQGLSGEAGAAGGVGAAGAAGDAGAVGAAGAAGTAGAAGNDGQAGAQGAAGLVGQPGTNGTNGTNGTSVEGQVANYSALKTLATSQGLGPSDAGRSWLNLDDGQLYTWNGSAFPGEGKGVEFRGQTGATGPTGAVGPAGPTGTTGQPGKDAVLPPQSVFLAQPELEPKDQTLDLAHYTASGKSALYYVRSDLGEAEINDITVSTTIGDASKITIDSRGPGDGDILTTPAVGSANPTSTWSGLAKSTPNSPLLLQIECTNASSKVCGAAVKVSYRKPIPLTIPLGAPPTDTVAVVDVKADVVHHQYPTASTPSATTYTLTSESGPTEIVGVGLGAGFGGTGNLLLGPDTLGENRPVVNPVLAQNFGGDQTDTLIVSPGKPLTVTMSCDFSAGKSTCGGPLTLKVRQPQARILGLGGPVASPQPFIMKRSPLTAASAPYVLRATAGDVEVTGIAALDEVGTASTVALGPTATQPRTTITSSSDFSATPYAGRAIVASGLDYPLELNCSSAATATGCTVQLSVTFGAPAAEPATIVGRGSATVKMTYNPAQNVSGRYLIAPSPDAVITAATLTSAGAGSTIRLTPGGQQETTAASGARLGVSRLATSAVPVEVVFSCPLALNPGGCTGDLAVESAAPDTSVVSVVVPQSNPLIYAPAASTPQTGRYFLTTNRDSEITQLSLSDSRTPGKGAALRVFPAKGDAFTVVAGTPWQSTPGVLVTPSSPLLVELTCSEASLREGCVGDLSTALGDPTPLRVNLDPVKPGSDRTKPSWNYQVLYDPKQGQAGNGRYSFFPPQEVEFTSVTVAPGNNVASVSVGGITVAPGPAASVSLFANETNPLPVVFTCSQPTAVCSTGLTVTGSAPLPPDLVLDTDTQRFDVTSGLSVIQPGQTARYMIRLPASTGDRTLTSFGIAPRSFNSARVAEYDVSAKISESMSRPRDNYTFNVNFETPSSASVRMQMAVTRPLLLEITCNSGSPCSPAVDIGSRLN